MHKSLKSALAVLSLATPSLALASSWELDPSHTTARFSVRYMMMSNVQGEMGATTGTIEVDDKDVTKSSVQATIDVNGVDTRDAKRDQHLKTADFFDTAKHPTMTFKSKKVEKAGENKLKVTGDLTMRGVTKEVVLEVETSKDELKDPWGNTKRGGVATTTLNRKDFGVSWNKSLDNGGVLVGDEVKVTIDLTLVKKQPKKS